MADLGVLARIPGLAGYLQQNAINDEGALSQVRQASGAMGVLSEMNKQQVEGQKRALEDKGRGVLASLPADATSEQVMQAMRPYVSPEHLFNWTQQAEIKKTQMDQTKQIAFSRLSQQAQKDLQDVSYKAAQAKTAAEKFHWQQEEAKIKNGFAKQAADIQAGRYTYETGYTVNPFQPPANALPDAPPVAPGPVAPGPVAPMAPTEGQGQRGIQPASGGGDMSGSASPVDLANRITNPADRAGALAQLAQQTAPVAPPAAPIAPPVPPAVPTPLASGTRQIRGAPALIGPTPPAAGVTPESVLATPAASAAKLEPAMPEFKGSPKAIAQAQNAWLTAKAKSDIKISVMGANESTQLQRVIGGAHEATQVLKNLVELPISGSLGVFGFRGTPKGLFNAAADTLAQSLSTQETQDYIAVTQGLPRFLAAIESMGQSVPQGLTNSVKTVLDAEGMTNATKLRNMAEIRQIIEMGGQVVLSNPRAAEEQKALFRQDIEDIRKTIPFTQNDISRLQARQMINKNVTLADVIKLAPNAQPGATGGAGWSIRPR